MPTPPVTEGFEGGTLANLPAYWSTEKTSGTISIQPFQAHNGTYALIMTDDTSHYSSSYYQEAILHVDLSGTTNVTIDFWAKEYSGNSSSASAAISTDGTNWVGFGLVNGSAQYEHYAFDLDALGLTYSQDVQIRFRHDSYYDGGFAFDDIRVATSTDLFGPRVLSINPTNLASGASALTNVVVMFNEAMDAATFTAADVSLKDPQGVVIGPVSVAVVAGSTNRQFNLSFASQSVRGQYRLVVGPQVTDVAGNPMNQDNDAVNGEAADVYNGTMVYAPTVTTNQAPEGFEGWSDGAVPSQWSLISAGSATIRPVTSDSPHGGAQHLQFNANGVGASWSEYATVALNLTNLTGRTDVSLDFWAKYAGGSYAYFYVELSGDGTNFVNVWSVSLAATYTQYTLDLDALCAANGIALDADVYIRFRDYNPGYTDHRGYLDDVRVVAGVDLAGPQVLSHAPATLAAGAGPLTNVVVTFNEPIDPASFTASDVVLKDAQGVAITPVIAAVAGTTNRQFNLGFAAQSVRGTYQLSVGPNVADVAGNLMNQNGNAVNGEAADVYNGTMVYAPTVTTNQAPEGFEGWSDGAVPSQWSLISAGSATIRPVTSDSPHGGAQHLQFNANGVGASWSEYATVALNLTNLTGRTDVSLDFWAKDAGGSYAYFYVELSGDGTNFVNVWSVSLAATYTQYTLDLDALCAANGIALDADVYIRFRDYNPGYTDHRGYLDDVRVVAGVDLAGPQVLSHAPATLAAGAGPLTNVVVTFNEPIDPASFTASDVVLKDAQGVAITPVIAAVAGTTNRQFNLGFAAQSVRGTYQLSVGPNVADVAGNLMNQNGNAVNGEAADVYNGTMVYAPTVTTNQAPEGFEGWSDGAVPSQWSLISAGSATIRPVTSDSPHGGAQHLQFNANGVGASWSEYATVALNLTNLTGRTDVSLDFWAKYAGGSYAYFYVELSGDGTNFVNVWSVSLAATYTQYTLDLDALCAANGIALDADVYIRFRDYNPGYTDHRGYLDDVRVVAGVDLAGPQVLSHAPATLAAGAGPLTNVVVTFNEPIDPASFTASDVVLKDAQGVAITPVIAAVAGTTNRQFNLGFAAQSVRGTYQLRSVRTWRTWRAT